MTSWMLPSLQFADRLPCTDLLAARLADADQQAGVAQDKLRNLRELAQVRTDAHRRQCLAAAGPGNGRAMS
ncbi:hypothetical protein [Novosphingobium sp. BL-52-GroH]|uniref:hypothetical protein n=1 Tax=Novosphingobium sp. BL-52-GroH TaxID=3349877 RepID=UPI00384FF2D1